MQIKLTVLILALLSGLAATQAVHPECSARMRDIEGNLIDLRYSAQEQDFLGVLLNLKPIFKASELIVKACSRESFDLKDRKEYNLMEGCREIFEIFQEITSNVRNFEGKLSAVRMLDRFSKVFKEKCLDGDKYFAMASVSDSDSYLLDVIQDYVEDLLNDENELMIQC